jgi:hypothetical protein
MPIEHPSNWDKIYASAVLSIPVMMMAAFASIAYMWTVDDPTINQRRKVGTAMLACVVGWMVLQYGPWLFPDVPIEVISATAVLLGIFSQTTLEIAVIKIRNWFLK